MAGSIIKVTYPTASRRRKQNVIYCRYRSGGYAVQLAQRDGMSAHGPDAGRGSCPVIIMLELVLVVSVGGCASHRRTVPPSSASPHVTYKKAKLQNETKDEKTNNSTEPCNTIKACPCQQSTHIGSSDESLGPGCLRERHTHNYIIIVDLFILCLGPRVVCGGCFAPFRSPNFQDFVSRRKRPTWPIISVSGSVACCPKSCDWL